MGSEIELSYVDYFYVSSLLWWKVFFPFFRGGGNLKGEEVKVEIYVVRFVNIDDSEGQAGFPDGIAQLRGERDEVLKLKSGRI